MGLKLKMRNRASPPEIKKQSRLDEVIKILGKARDLYMKGIEDCVGKTGLDAVMVAGGPFPATLGGSRSGEEGFVIRVPAELTGRRRRVRRLAAERLRRRRGCGVIRLGRIDEDVACCFEEDVNVETFLLDSRNVRVRNAGRLNGS